MNDNTLSRVASLPQLAGFQATNNKDNLTINNHGNGHGHGGNIVRSRSSAELVDADEAHSVQPHTGYKKVLVTGGAGFIGSHVVEALLDRGDDVVIIDEMNDYYDVLIKESNIQYLQSLVTSRDRHRLVFYKGDICDEELMIRIFQEEKIEWICHLAARAGVRPSIEDPFVYIHSNIRGTTLLLELASKFKIENFVFASSSR